MAPIKIATPAKLSSQRKGAGQFKDKEKPIQIRESNIQAAKAPPGTSARATPERAPSAPIINRVRSLQVSPLALSR